MKPITLDEISQAQRILNLAAIEGQQRLLITGDPDGAQEVMEMSLAINKLVTYLFSLELGVDMTLGETEVRRAHRDDDEED